MTATRLSRLARVCLPLPPRDPAFVAAVRAIAARPFAAFASAPESCAPLPLHADLARAWSVLLHATRARPNKKSARAARRQLTCIAFELAQLSPGARAFFGAIAVGCDIETRAQIRVRDLVRDGTPGADARLYEQLCLLATPGSDLVAGQLEPILASATRLLAATADAPEPPSVAERERAAALRASAAYWWPTRLAEPFHEFMETRAFAERGRLLRWHADDEWPATRAAVCAALGTGDVAAAPEAVVRALLGLVRAGTPDALTEAAHVCELAACTYSAASAARVGELTRAADMPAKQRASEIKVARAAASLARARLVARFWHRWLRWSRLDLLRATPHGDALLRAADVHVTPLGACLMVHLCDAAHASLPLFVVDADVLHVDVRMPCTAALASGTQRPFVDVAFAQHTQFVLWDPRAPAAATDGANARMWQHVPPYVRARVVVVVPAAREPANTQPVVRVYCL